jgi:spore germination cell wall hydrolase CwlJ-like protein
MLFSTAAMCLATAIYFEARGEPIAGQVAVANVIVNRTNDRRYPNTICEVVQQGPTYRWAPSLPVRNRCQFSFYCDGKKEVITDNQAFDKAIDIAKRTLNGEMLDITEGATHYHALYVLPDWAATKTHTVTINNHIFYRWETR